MKAGLICALALVLVCHGAVAQVAAVPAPPATAKHPVTDSYHGVAVTDDYRWLENGSDAAVRSWSAAQDARTRTYLGQLADRPAIAARFAQLIGTPSVHYDGLQFRGGQLFALQYLPKQQQPLLVTLPSADDPGGARVVFDPNRLSARGAYAISAFAASADARYVAVVLSKDESEDGTAQVYEVATGRKLPDEVPRAFFATGGGSIAWQHDDSGFYYTRYPHRGERAPADINFYQQVYWHRLGTDSSQDRYVIGRDFPRIAEIELRASDDGQWLLATVANGDGGQFSHYLMDTHGRWRQVTHFDDAVVAARLGERDLYLLSRKSAPRGRVLRLPLAAADLAHATVVVPQSPGAGADEAARAAIEDIAVAATRLYVLDTVGGPSRLRVFDGGGHALAGAALPPVSSADELVPVGHGDALFLVQSYLAPPAWYRYDAARGEAVRTALAETSPVHFEDAEVVREFATSRDGTRVPLNIIRLKTARLDGSSPLLLTAYGGFNLSSKPSFDGWLKGAAPRIWLDQGGVFVEANIRGGGEYGEEWHRQGKLTRKQNVFDDFIAGASYLVQRHYTSPEHLAICGGSNGGLLMGAVLTQRPELARAVVADSGVFDMLRSELTPNGAFNAAEYGSVKDPGQFRALYAYSPYHRVRDGVAYPAIYLFAGENDNRVDPWHSRKMTARLQAADRSARPVLLRVRADAGHGWGEALDVQVAEDSDIFAFLLDQLGMRYRGP